MALEKRTPDKVFRTIVPLHSTLAKGTLSAILRQAGITADELRELL